MPSVAHEQLADFVTWHLTVDEIVVLGRQLAHHHHHKFVPPKNVRHARAWFAGYIARSISRADALRYLKELRRRKDSGEALLRRIG